MKLSHGHGWAVILFLAALLFVCAAPSAPSYSRGFHGFGGGHGGGSFGRHSGRRQSGYFGRARLRARPSRASRDQRASSNRWRFRKPTPLPSTHARWPRREPTPPPSQAGWQRREPTPPPPGQIWWPIRKPTPPAPIVAIGGVGALPLAIAGGGRPPIAPRFLRDQGQSPSAAAAALLNNKRHRARELLIEVPNDSADELKQALANEYGAEVRELGVIELINARIWHLTLIRGQDLGAVLQQLLQDSRVISAQPNYVYAPVQGDAGRSAAGYSKAALPSTPDGALPRGEGIKVAIIDTCVDRDHSELQGSVQTVFDATPSGSASCEAENHGTAVASLIGGHENIHGSAAAAAIISARAFVVTEEEKETVATSREIALALNWAARQGARVANLSFAGPSDPLIERAIQAAYTNGLVLVGAAGNAGPSSGPLYPAAYPEVIAVTATDARRELYGAANRGSHIAVSARGVDVIVAHVHNAYGADSGTSFAAATVSGIAALLVEIRPKATPAEIRAALQNTAASVSSEGRNDLFGYGLVNAKAAAAFIELTVSQ